MIRALLLVLALAGGTPAKAPLEKRLVLLDLHPAPASVAVLAARQAAVYEGILGRRLVPALGQPVSASA